MPTHTLERWRIIGFNQGVFGVNKFPFINKRTLALEDGSVALSPNHPLTPIEIKPIFLLYHNYQNSNGSDAVAMWDKRMSE